MAEQVIETDQLSDYMEAILNVIGVLPSRKRNTPIARPKVKKKIESVGWKPEYEGQQPPF